MRDRKEQIIKEAMNIVAEEGYESLSMRAVARASGLKLGALQYHFQHWGDLLRGMADYIIDQYFNAQKEYGQRTQQMELDEIVQFILDDEAGEALNSQKLFPQLWAMAQVEPIMDKLMAEIYSRYIDMLEESLADLDVPNPRIHAQTLTVLMESSLLFLSWDRKVKNVDKAERKLALAYIESIQSGRN